MTITGLTVLVPPACEVGLLVAVVVASMVSALSSASVGTTKACWADVIITAVFPSGHSESTVIVYSNAGIFVERRGNAASIRCIKDKDQS
jgi:hypothetical protein